MVSCAQDQRPSGSPAAAPVAFYCRGPIPPSDSGSRRRRAEEAGGGTCECGVERTRYDIPTVCSKTNLKVKGCKSLFCLKMTWVVILKPALVFWYQTKCRYLSSLEWEPECWMVFWVCGKNQNKQFEDVRTSDRHVFCIFWHFTD